MSVITREEWGARAPGSRNDLDPEPKGTGIHWHGPPIAARVRHHHQCPGVVRAIQNHHMDVKGWGDIGYSDLVCPHGYRFEGRGRGVGSAAFGTEHGNRYYYATCAIWGKGDGPANSKMLEALTRAVAEHRAWGAGADVIGHRDEYETECPGDELYAYVHAGRFAADLDLEDVAPVAPVDLEDAEAGALVPPPYPLPPGSYFGPKHGPTESVSGYYSHREDLRTWQARMGTPQDEGGRGWTLAADGLYGPKTARVARRFQREKGLRVDGLIGPVTWDAAWLEEITP